MGNVCARLAPSRTHGAYPDRTKRDDSKCAPNCDLSSYSCSHRVLVSNRHHSGDPRDGRDHDHTSR